MASVLEAMGFPRGWCERALRASGGVEPAVELLLHWQADGASGLGEEEEEDEDPRAASASPPAVSTVTDVAAASSGLDAVVPDAGIVEQTINCPAASEEVEEDEKDRRSRKETPVELQIRCSGYPTIKGTFSAGATLKEVRDFVLRELQTQQPVASASTNSRRSRRTSSLRSNGISALLPSGRVNQRSKKMLKYADPSSTATSAHPVAVGSFYFLITFPRKVFDTEESMETTLYDANLYPRGILTVQFQSKEESPSTSEPSTPQVERHLHTSPSGGHHRRVEDVSRREQRLKATLDRYGNGNMTNEAPPETRGAASASMPATSLGMVGREEPLLEVDGERVRHRELALQAAAKRMTEAAQMFREGFLPDEGEPGGGFRSPSDKQSVPAAATTACNDDLSRIVLEDLDCKGKQVAADCSPSSPARDPVHDVGSNFAPGFRGRASRARLPLPPPSPSRPEKLQRTDEVSSTRLAAGANHVPRLFASDHAIERVPRRGDQTLSSESMWIRGPPGSGSSSVSELRIRLEDGSVLRRTFPAYTTLQSVVECAMPVRLSTAEYGLILKTPGSQFFEGEALSSTLEEVGLVPSGVVHLQKVASRGLVTQGRRRALRMIRYLQNRNNEPEPELEQLWQDFSRRMNTNLTYEELVELEDSIGRVNVGLPEATIANLPTHTVSRSAGDICIVCLSEMVEGEEVMVLPCLHTFHPVCIRQWLLQSTCCPTCKHHIT